MARWRAKALELLPEFSKEIQRLESPYMLWIELGHEFKRAYDMPINEDIIRRFYMYADWCWRQRQKDLWNSVAVCFYEHLPDHRAVRKDMPRWLSPDKFRDLAGLFEWRLGQDKFLELKRYYEANVGMYESNLGRSSKLARGVEKRMRRKQIGR